MAPSWRAGATWLGRMHTTAKMSYMLLQQGAGQQLSLSFLFFFFQHPTEQYMWQVRCTHSIIHASCASKRARLTHNPDTQPITIVK